MKSYITDLLQGGFLTSLTSDLTWGWPIAEILHFAGLTLLVGSIGILDLRMLGLAKALTPASVHRLVPVGIAGFLINVFTGLVFMASDPMRCLDNPLFQLKMLFVLIGGLNAGLFYVTVYKTADRIGPGEPSPFLGKAIASVSLLCWFGVIILGRMMPFI